MVGAEYAGLTFYYYYYNPTADTLEYLQSAVVDDDGKITPGILLTPSGIGQRTKLTLSLQGSCLAARVTANSARMLL